MNEFTLRQWYDIFKDNKELVEIRILDPETKRSYSGYFTDIERILSEIRRYEKCNLYFTLNVIDPACYSREQHDRISTRPKSTTSDNEILARKWCLIDIDCEKPSDTNSTDEEKELAKSVVNNVYKFLRDEGFEQPVICDSSNGFHLLYKQAMLSNQQNTETMKNFLKVLDMYFSTDKVKIDCSTFNPSRICKLYGVVSRKGSDTKERPQRESKILRVPQELKVTQNEYFEKVASYLPKPEKRDRTNNYGVESFDLDDFLAKYNIAVRNIIETRDYTKYVLEECPFNSAHRAPDSAVFKMRDGSYGFKCLHNSDRDYTFRDFRLHYDANAYERKYTEPHRTFRPFQKEKTPIVLQDNDEDKGNVWQSLDEIKDEDRSQIVTIPSGITKFDEECCGYDKPSVNVWSGNNGSGKSSLLNQLALNAVNNGFKVAIYSGELRGNRLKRWVLLQAAGKTYNKKSLYNNFDYYTPNNIRDKIVEWLKGNLYNYNTKYSSNIEQVCVEIENLVKTKGIDMIIIDNLSCLDIDTLEGAVNEQQKNAIKMIVRLTNNINVATHLIIHPKKSYGGYLRKEDVSGVKTLTDLADNVFFVHRWNQDTQKAAKEFMPKSVYDDIEISRATNIVEVIKMREYGEAEGHIYKLFYESESRRLKNNIAENVTYGWCEQNSMSQLPLEQPTSIEQMSNIPNLPFEASSEEAPF